MLPKLQAPPDGEIRPMNIPHYWQQGCTHLSQDSVMAQLITSYQGEQLQSRGDAFTTLVRSIVGQQVSVRAAASLMLRLEATVDQLSPGCLLDLDDVQRRQAGLSRAKARYCREVARLCLAPPDWTAPPEQLKKRLLQVPGIGEWTWQMFAIFYLQLPDELPLKDLGLRKAIVRAYGLHDDSQLLLPAMLERTDSWRPYRTIATWYLWRSLDPVPVVY